MIKYTEDHEWVRVEGEEAVIGITDYAQKALGDVVFVELPSEGAELSQGDEVCVVESVKAASEVYAAVSGEVIGVNEALEGEPALVNSSPMDDGWIVRVKLSDASELDGLMDEAAYNAHVADLG